MDAPPKTRREQKSGKYKQVFNQKTIRLKEALIKVKTTSVSKSKT